MKENAKTTDTDYGVRPPADLNPRLDPVLDFPDAEFGELSAADYETLGFMSGLEVHQQLLTRSKLFCRCPAGRLAKLCDSEVLRHMRPTLSEMGEYDGTALMEFKTRKEIVYQLEHNSVCTYEIDSSAAAGMQALMSHPAFTMSHWWLTGTPSTASPSRSPSCSISTWCPSFTLCENNTWTGRSRPGSSARRWWASMERSRSGRRSWA